MKIIDKTPLQDENGAISFANRVQGTLKFGLSWFAELEAQKSVIARLDQSLDKSFTLIRNFSLPNSDIIIPMILVGVGGISVIYVTNVKGQFEAKGDQWNTVNNGKSEPAGINILGRVAQLTRAFQKYLELQKISIPSPVDTVLIAADPGAHIESMRPAARIVLSDGIKQYTATLLKTRPIWNSENIHGIVERILTPRKPDKKQTSAIAEPPSQPLAHRDTEALQEEQDKGEFSRNAFGFDEEPMAAPASVQPAQTTANTAVAHQSPRPTQRRPQPPSKSRKIMGMSAMQITILGLLLLCGFLAIGGLGYYFFILAQ